jgi:hypothetical protein
MRAAAFSQSSENDANFGNWFGCCVGISKSYLGTTAVWHGEFSRPSRSSCATGTASGNGQSTYHLLPATSAILTIRRPTNQTLVSRLVQQTCSLPSRFAKNIDQQCVTNAKSDRGKPPFGTGKRDQASTAICSQRKPCRLRSTTYIGIQ